MSARNLTALSVGTGPHLFPSQEPKRAAVLPFERYLKMQLSWAERLTALSPAALRVGILLSYLDSLHKHRSAFVVAPRIRTQFKISKSQFWRGLDTLEKAGMIGTYRQQGRWPRAWLRSAPHTQT